MGFALEQYDAVGRVRPEKQITTAKLPTRKSITGIADLRQMLLKHKNDTYIRHLTEKLLSYALGRRLRFADQRPLETILSQLKRITTKLTHSFVRSFGAIPFETARILPYKIFPDNDPFHVKTIIPTACLNRSHPRLRS